MIRQKLPDGTTNPEWVAARRGKLGASRIADILKDGRQGKPSQTRSTLAKQLAAERWAGYAKNNVNPNNPHILRGNENEKPALNEYQVIRGCWLAEAAWVEHPRFPEFGGATPDAFHENDGLVQIKSPDGFKMADLMLAQVVPAEYIPQLDWELAVTGREWNDLVLYNPELGEGRHIWIRRHYRDEKRIAHIEAEVEKFEQEVEAYFDALCKINFYEEA